MKPCKSFNGVSRRLDVYSHSVSASKSTGDKSLGIPSLRDGTTYTSGAQQDCGCPPFTPCAVLLEFPVATSAAEATAGRAEFLGIEGSVLVCVELVECLLHSFGCF